MSSIKKSDSPVTQPTVGDEYVLVKKESIDKIVESKEVKMASIAGAKIASSHLFGAAEMTIAYGFNLAMQTGSALSTSVALAVANDGQWASFKQFFKYYTMHSASLMLDFHEFTSTVGFSQPFHAMSWCFDPVPKITTEATYDVLSDYQGVKNIDWSSAKPIVRYEIPHSILKDVFPADRDNVGSLTRSKWLPTAELYPQAFGCVRIASNGVFFAGEPRSINCRLTMQVKLRNKFGGA